MLIYSIGTLLITSYLLIFVIEKRMNFRNLVQKKLFNVQNKNRRKTSLNFMMLSFVLVVMIGMMYFPIGVITSRVLVGLILAIYIYTSILFNPDDVFGDFYKKKSKK